MAPSSGPEAFRRAYEACEQFARAHYENFPVASRLLPASMRPHIAAVYAFARIGDDIADEGTDASRIRRGRLARWQQRLHDAVATAPTPSETDAEDTLIVCALAHSMRERSLPLQLFDDLMSAFAQDIETTRYDSWSDLFDYCRRSANPVGRLALRIAGYDNAALDRSSDALCTALQLTNFWQDFGRDWAHGRLYVPAEVSAAHGADERDLRGGPLTPAWVQAIGECARITGARFDDGRSVCDGVAGRLRFELRATWLGGRRVLDRVVSRGAGLAVDRPRLGRADLAILLWQTLRWDTAV